MTAQLIKYLFIPYGAHKYTVDGIQMTISGWTGQSQNEPNKFHCPEGKIIRNFPEQKYPRDFVWWEKTIHIWIDEG